MALAVIYPDPEKGGRGKKSKVTTEFCVSQSASARLAPFWRPYRMPYLRYFPAPCPWTTYDKAQRQRDESKTEAARRAARLDSLRRKEPELADAVVEGKLTLEGAEAECGARERQRAQDWADLRGTFMLSAGERAIEEHDRSRR